LLAFAPKRAYPIGEEHETRWFREALEDSARLKAVLPHDFDIRRIGSAELSAQVGNHTRGADPQIMLEALFMTHAPTTQ
ncbi:MAG: hypothetical protein ACREGH_01980, partial [Minisyncoccia bacterium]